MTEVTRAYEVFTDVDGQPLDSGYIYIGVPGLDAEANPKAVFWDPARLIPAAQPIRTVAGMPYNSGSPGRLYVDGDYSIVLKDKRLQLVRARLTNVVGGGGVYEYTNLAAILADTVLVYTGSGTIVSAGQRILAEDSRYLYEVAASIATDHDLTTAGGVKLYVLPGEKGLNVKAFGAVGDGVADDSVPIKAAYLAACRARAVVPTDASGLGYNDVTIRGIYFPGGKYRVTQPRTLMDEHGLGRLSGLTYTGETGGTIIIFNFDGNDYLCYNNNENLVYSFQNISFYCNSDNSMFMLSRGDGGAQDALFFNCHWRGIWKKGFVLEDAATGSDNNSEFKWDSCSVRALIRDVWQEVPDTVASDQFLNYWSVNCKYWLLDGQMVRAAKGGHYKYTYCDWSGLGNAANHMAQCQSTNGKFLFEFTGRTHAFGVCNFEIYGGRFEHKTLTSTFLYCEWNQGNVHVQADFSSNAVTGYEDVIHTHFSTGNITGPIVTFQSCYIIGKHKYESGNTSFIWPRKAAYRDCTFRVKTPSLAFDLPLPDLVANGGAGNIAGAWPIYLTGCRSENRNYPGGSLDNQGNGRVDQVVWDCVLHGRYAMTGENPFSSFVFRFPWAGGTPYALNTNTEAAYALVPDTALITRVTFRSAGTLGSVAVPNFQVQDGLGGVIAESGADNALNTAWAVERIMSTPIPAGGALLKLVDAAGTANETNPNIFVEVEFIA